MANPIEPIKTREEVAKERQATSTGGKVPQLKPTLAEAVKTETREHSANVGGK